MVLALYVMAMWRAPEFVLNQDLLRQAPPEQRLSAEHNARLIVISVGGALVVGTGLLYTARNYRLAHRGQVTERFTKALERLDSDEMYVRIGGVHALEHVMRDSAEHHGDVVEVLVSFIRDRVPRRSDDQVRDDLWMHPPIGTDIPELPTEPAGDVQAALTALGQRPKRLKNERDWLNLTDLHLQGVSLPEAWFQNAVLDGAQLQRAHLTAAQLRHAFLNGVQLQDAFLLAAQLQTAVLSGAQLQRAYLANAQLQGAVLKGADLRGAQLDGADLRGADLTDAVLTAGQLDGARIDEYTTLPTVWRDQQDDVYGLEQL